MSELPRPVSAFGGHSTNEMFRLYVQGSYPSFINLDGHSLAMPTQDATEQLDIPDTRYDVASKSLVTTMVATKRTKITKRQASIGAPPWDISVLDELEYTGVVRDYMTLRADCEYCNRRAFIYKSHLALGQFTTSENLVKGGPDPTAELIGRTAPLEVNDIVDFRPLIGRVAKDVGANALYAALWQNAGDCSEAVPCPGGLFVGGGQIGGTAAEILASITTSTARFDTVAAINAGLPAGSIITAMILVDNTIVGTFADNINPATATTGGVFYFKNNVVTVGEDSGGVLAEPLYAITREGNRILAVGKGGATYVALKNNLRTGWLEITNAYTGHFLAVASTGNVTYIASSDGNAYSLTGVVFTDITAVVDPQNDATALNSVTHLGKGHIMFGGTPGFISENRKADNGGTWTVDIIGGGAGTVQTIAGTSERIFIGLDDEIQERSPFTMENDIMQFQVFELQGGQTLSGNIRQIVVLDWLYGPNVFAAVTTAGEIVYANPCYASC
jgi:hypothetical protein